MTTQKWVSLIAPSACAQNYSFFSNSFFLIQEENSKFDLLISHIHNSKVIQQKCQMSEELTSTASQSLFSVLLWAPSVFPGGRMPCCSISGTEGTAALTAAFAGQHSPHTLYKAWQKTWFSCWLREGWNYEGQLREKEAFQRRDVRTE